MQKILPFSRSSLIVLLLIAAVIFFPDFSHAFFSPGLEKLTAAEINEMLQSKRAKSKSDIKRFMEWGYVVPGGDAPSGLKLVGLDEWHPMSYRRKSFGISGNIISLSDYNSVSYWDLETRQLKEILFLEKDSYSIVGSTPYAPTLVISKYESANGDFLNVSFASFDANTLKKKVEFKGKVVLPGRKDEFRLHSARWSYVDYATSDDGKSFVVTANNGPFQSWLAETGRGMTMADQPHGGTNRPRNQFSPDGKRFYTTVGSGTTAVFDFASGQLLSQPPKTGILPVFSPDGKYIVIGNLLLTGDGKNKIATLPGNRKAAFAKGYLLSFYLDATDYSLIDGDEIFYVDLQNYKYPAKRLEDVRVSPDGKYSTLAYRDDSGVTGYGPFSFKVVEIESPSKDMAKLVLDAQRAMDLYEAGLHSQAVSMARNLIEKWAKALWFKSYDRKFIEACMPSSLAGEMLVKLIDGERKALASNPGSSSAVLGMGLVDYALWACYSRQPAAAVAAINLLAEGVANKTITISPKIGVQAIMLQCLSLKLMGKDEEAYSYLIEKVPSTQDMKNYALNYMGANKGTFGPLLEERKKVAVIFDMDLKEVAEPAEKTKKQDYVSLDGKLIIGGPPMPGKMGPSIFPLKNETQPKKSKSVVLD